MANRLRGLEVQEVSLVDDPAVPEAQYLITKRRDPAVQTTTVTDTATNESLLERIGKAAVEFLGGAPADQTTRLAIIKGAAEAAAAAEAEGDDEAEETAKADDEGAAEGAEAAADETEEEAEKAADEAEAAEDDEAEKAKRPRCSECGQYLPEGGDERHKAAEAEEAEESEEAEKAADDEAAPDIAGAVVEQVKGLLEAELAPIREALGKSIEATDSLKGRVEGLEKRRGVSKGTKGEEIAKSDNNEGGLFESVIFGA